MSLNSTHILSFALFAWAASPAWAEKKLDFNRDIRPILSDNCFACHGPDKGKIKGDLRLDDRDLALKGGESDGPAIVPGKPDESSILGRIVTANEDDHMPPKASAKPPLTEQQVATLRQWITEGAEYKGHWAFIPPVRPEVPDVKQFAAQIPDPTPIDSFILSRLAEEGLAPSPEADRRTLIRRVSLDLTGLPPSPEQVETFVNDKAPDAYEKVVDHMLASPHYGERMAMPWLDNARFADSHGFQSDASRTMWPWRDWVINAFNENKPFDQFTIEQLAGDMLPGATTDQIIATGFNRNHRINGEGGIIDQEWFVENVIDRVETTALTWMALTFNCCRCHDHKYDPISQKNFYQLFAYFNSVDEKGTIRGGANDSGGNASPTISFPTPEQSTALIQAEELIKGREANLSAMKSTRSQRMAAWEAQFQKEVAMKIPAWKPLHNEAAVSEGGATLTRQADGSWLASGNNPDNDVYVISAPIPAGPLTGILLETLPDPSLPAQSLGRSANGNFVLTDVDVEITAPELPIPIEGVFSKAEALYEQKGYAVSKILDGKATRAKGAKNTAGWAVDGPTRKEPNKALFVIADPMEVPADATLKVTLRHDAIGGHNIGRFRISISDLPASSLKLDGDALSESVQTILQMEAAKRTPAQKTELQKFFAESADVELKSAEAALAEATKARDKVKKAILSTMVMKELPAPRDAFLLKRGEYDHPGDKVDRGLPAFLPPLPAGEPNNRLGLAKWLVSGNHPLTARVWVNRAWEHFFGQGLCRTTENFGSQSEWPSHPELLDWLATEFVRLRWDMKAMQKVIVMSATYRQAGKVTPQLLEKDPENRLLARGPRVRLSGETLRDQALAVSGLLKDKIGGPSVRPYMPEGIWDETSRYGDLRNYKNETGEGLYRRTLYTIWKRSAGPPTLQLFDAPTRDVCTIKRSRTNTPLQALALLNEVTFVEAARVLAQRMLAEGGDTPESRFTWAMQHLLARPPTASELKILTAGFQTKLERFQKAPEEAQKLAAFGEAKSTSPTPELAAYAVMANVLLNLDEVITRE